MDDGKLGKCYICLKIAELRSLDLTKYGKPENWGYSHVGLCPDCRSKQKVYLSYYDDFKKTKNKNN